MGAGKTTTIINMAKEFKEKESNSNKRLLILTYYLTEIKRICDETGFKAPPKGMKRQYIKKMIDAGQNIVASQALFSMFDFETLELFKGRYSYNLIMDEPPQVISLLVGSYRKRNEEEKSIIEQFSTNDYKMMIKDNIINIDNDKTRRITWNSKTDYSGIYNELRRHMEISDLYSYKNDKTIIAATSMNVWHCFENITVCGYLIRNSIFDNYLDWYGIEKVWYHIENGTFKEGYKFEKPKNLNNIVVYAGNFAGESLSRYW